MPEVTSSFGYMTIVVMCEKFFSFYFQYIAKLYRSKNKIVSKKVFYFFDTSIVVSTLKF